MKVKYNRVLTLKQTGPRFTDDKCLFLNIIRWKAMSIQFLKLSKLNVVILAIVFFCFYLISCDRIDRQFTFVNLSKSTVTIYTPKSIQVSNRELFERFKSKTSASDTTAYISIEIKPGGKHKELSLGSFEKQFDSKGIMYLLVLDVDSVRAMTKKNKPDSSIQSRLVLKSLKLSKEELESNDRNIIFSEK